MRAALLLIFGPCVIAGCAASRPPARDGTPPISRASPPSSLDLGPAVFSFDQPTLPVHPDVRTTKYAGGIRPWGDWVEIYEDGTYALTITFDCGNADPIIEHGQWSEIGDVITLVDDHGDEMRRLRRSDGGLGFTIFSRVEEAESRDAWDQLWERAIANGVLY